MAWWKDRRRTNRWLGYSLHMGNMYEVSRKVGAWAHASATR